MHSKQLNNLSDTELIGLFKNSGDNDCIGILYQRYSHLVFGVCMKYLKDPDDSQDASIQIFEKLLTDLKKHEIANFKAWLHMVCKNFCLMQLRSAASKLRHHKEMIYDFNVHMENADYLHHHPENIKELHLTHMEECIKNLNNEQRLCVELFYLQEKSYNEVAEMTSFTINNVKSYIQNGKRNLKICVESKSHSIIK
jgi:RNA polymerase sigma factor (sigma-70 family)